MSKRFKKHKQLRRKQPKSWCLVYVLKHKGIPFYIGQTRCHPEVRLKYHIKHVKKKLALGEKFSPVQTRINKILPDLPEIQVIDSKGIWDISEAVWIDRYTREGHLLLNVLSRVDERPTS